MRGGGGFRANHQTGPVVAQERINAIRINEPMIVTATEPRQPMRLEKKKNKKTLATESGSGRRALE